MPLGCKIYEPTHPHFLTCTVLHWLPIFTNQESVKIILDSLRYLQKSEKMMLEKINYIHQNLVKRGYVDEAEHWRYSSARDYNGTDGLLEIERLW